MLALAIELRGSGLRGLVRVSGLNCLYIASLLPTLVLQTTTINTITTSHHSNFLACFSLSLSVRVPEYPHGSLVFPRRLRTEPRSTQIRNSRHAAKVIDDPINTSSAHDVPPQSVLVIGLAELKFPAEQCVLRPSALPLRHGDLCGHERMELGVVTGHREEDIGCDWE
jgi:hypothetical protein